jgi:hypothetical protein
MKKTLLIVLAVLISVAFVTTVFAQTTDKAASKATAEKAAKPAAEKAAKAEAKKEAPKVQEFKGDFVSADAKAKTLVAKDDKGEVTFSVAKKIAKFAAGDKIIVKYTEKDGKKVASSVKKAPAEKKAEAKKDAPAAEKKAEPKKDAPAPAKK